MSRTPKELQKLYNDYKKSDESKSPGAFPIAKLGMKLYYPYRLGFVVPVKVEEIDDIILPSEEKIRKYGLKEDSSVWVYRFINEETRITGYVSPTEDNPWGFSDSLPIDVIVGGRIVNQFVDIDEVVGHSVQIGDEVFLTLDEALNSNGFNSKLIKRRAKLFLAEFRGARTNFVNKTQSEAGIEPCCQLITKNKPIYIRVG